MPANNVNGTNQTSLLVLQLRTALDSPRSNQAFFKTCFAPPATTNLDSRDLRNSNQIMMKSLIGSSTCQWLDQAILDLRPQPQKSHIRKSTLGDHVRANHGQSWNHDVFFIEGSTISSSSPQTRDRNFWRCDGTIFLVAAQPDLRELRPELGLHSSNGNLRGEDRRRPDSWLSRLPKYQEVKRQG